MKMRDRTEKHPIPLFITMAIWEGSDLGLDTNFSALTPSN